MGGRSLSLTPAWLSSLPIPLSCSTSSSSTSSAISSSSSSSSMDSRLACTLPASNLKVMKQVGRHLARQKQITWVWQPGVFHYPGSLFFPTETLVCGWKSEGQREAIKAWIELQGPMFFIFSIWVELGFDINTTNICTVSSQNRPFPFLEPKRKTLIFAERGKTTNNIFAPTLLTWRQAAGCRRRRGVAADDVEGWVPARGGGGGDHHAGDHQVGGGHYGGGDHVLPQDRPR